MPAKNQTNQTPIPYCSEWNLHNNKKSLDNIGKYITLLQKQINHKIKIKTNKRNEQNQTAQSKISKQTNQRVERKK